MIDRFRDTWEGLQQREQRLLIFAFVSLLLLAGWIRIWEPLADSRGRLRIQLADQQAVMDWLDRVAPEVRRLRENDSATAVSQQRSPMAVIDQQARASGLAGSLRRIEPVGPGDLRVVMERAAFPDLMNWLLAVLSSHPFTILRLTAERAGPGRVDAAIVFSVGSADRVGQ